jgi:hypothetical protein
MTVKLLMSWNIKPGREQEYFEFVVREWVPGMQRLGLEPTEAWYTLYGQAPQILAGVTADNLKTMRQVLETEDWQALLGQLHTFVDDFEQKVIPASGGFQL